MSETMVEKVARAIYAKRNGAGAKPLWSRPKSHREPYMDDARAAIEAMREPTLAMISAAIERNQGPDEDLYASVFSAMISAALGEEA